jgi:hypothetical protein
MWVLDVLAYQPNGEFECVGTVEDNMQRYVRRLVKAHQLTWSLDGYNTRGIRMFTTRWTE